MLLTQQSQEYDDEAQDHDQHAVAACERAVGGGQDEVVVANRLLPPLKCRADICGHLVARDQRGQWLVGEDLVQHKGSGREDRREHGEQSVAPTSGHDGAHDGTDTREQGGHGHETTGSECKGERGDGDGDRIRQQSACGDGTFDAAPRQECADRFRWFGPQTVVVGQPECEIDECRRPHGRSARAHRSSQPRDHLAGDEPPSEKSE